MSNRYTAPISILFVDPDTQGRAYWVRRLASSSPDYFVTTAEDGRTALEMCRFRKFDCVVLELVLPDISGFEILANLCPLASKPAVAIVILTKLVFATLPPLAKSNGAQAYLMKSHTSGDQLDLAIRKAIAAIGPTNKELAG